VTHVTVARTIQRLQRDGVVTTQPYRSIFLTDAGRKLAQESQRRHEIVFGYKKPHAGTQVTPLQLAQR
jgi:DtxR family manganese transport transcriptional regulator